MGCIYVYAPNKAHVLFFNDPKLRALGGLMLGRLMLGCLMLGCLMLGRLMLGCLIVGDLIVGCSMMMCFASNFVCVVCVLIVMWLE